MNYFNPIPFNYLLNSDKMDINTYKEIKDMGSLKDSNFNKPSSHIYEELDGFLLDTFFMI